LGLYAAYPGLAIANGWLLDLTHFAPANRITSPEKAIAVGANMSDPIDRYSLRRTHSPQEWTAYHAIRRNAIFAPLLPGQTYDEGDTDEFKPGNLPHVLFRDGEVIGTVRIDLIDDTQAGLRLIGIRTDLQRQGHGSVLLTLAEQAARAFGRTETVINAHPTSLTFYLANGYREGEWRDQGPAPPGLIRVGKRLAV
jgi:GNAT superfamily N-acetyltransferase